MEEDQGQISEAAIDDLLSVERQMRRSGDVEGTRNTVLDILDLCFQAGAWNTLNEQILFLCKQPQQLKQATLAMVQQAMQYVDQAPDVETQIELIKTLTSVTARKSYLEIERARLIKKLARIREEQGLIAVAADFMLEVEVENIRDMVNSEKIYLMLEQVSLCLDRGDYVRAQILLRKIDPSLFECHQELLMSDEELPGEVPSLVGMQKIFYKLMIRYHSHSNDYLEICHCYKSIYGLQTDEEEDPDQWIPVLRKICWYLVLSPHSPEQYDLLISTLENDKNLSEIPQFELQSLLKSFATMDVIQWDAFWNTVTDEFDRETNVLPDLPAFLLVPECFFTQKEVEVLKLRVIEHNIIVISTCYSRITLTRLSDLLDLSVQETEKHLCDMVVSKRVAAKMDRTSGVVSFGAAKDINYILNCWASNSGKLLELVDNICDEIDKLTLDHIFDVLH